MHINIGRNGGGLKKAPKNVTELYYTIKNCLKYV